MTRATRRADGVAHVLLVLLVAVVAVAAMLALSDATKSTPRSHRERAPARTVTFGASVAAPAAGGPGAVLVDVAPGSPAQAAGLVAGDLLAAIDGTTVTSPQDVTTVLARHRPGDTVSVEWFDAAHVYHDAQARLAP